MQQTILSLILVSGLISGIVGLLAGYGPVGFVKGYFLAGLPAMAILLVMINAAKPTSNNSMIQKCSDDKSGTNM